MIPWIINGSTLCAVVGTLMVVRHLCLYPLSGADIRAVRDYFSVWGISLILILLYDSILSILTGSHVDVYALRPLMNRPLVATNTLVLWWRLSQSKGAPFI